MSRRADQPFPRFSIARLHIWRESGLLLRPATYSLVCLPLALPSLLSRATRSFSRVRFNTRLHPPSLARSPRDTHERRKYVSLSWLRLFMRCERYARASSSRTFSSVLHTSKQPSKRLHDLPSNWRNSSRISPPNLGVRPSNSLRQSNLLLLRRACAHHCNREVRLTLAS